MKKVTALFVLSVLILNLSACAPGNHSSSSRATSGSSSAGSASSEAGQVPASSQTTPAFHEVSEAPSVKAQTAENKGSYHLKNTEYTYNKDNNDFSVSYPQISGLSAYQDQVNAALKSCAMKTVASVGTGAKKQKEKIRTGGDAVYTGKSFLSVGFNEYVTPQPKAAATHTLRTVNIDLTTGKTVSFSDLIKDGGSFYAALQKAAQAQFSAQYASKATASAIQSGLDKNSMFFTASGVGFAVTLPGTSQLLRVTLGFGEVKPFVTSSTVWKNFI